LFIDGRVEGTISLPDNRITVGRNGNVAAKLNAKELVVMGKVQGNVECTDRLDIRSEGSLTGDVITHRISIEEGALVKGGIEVRTPEKAPQAQGQAKGDVRNCGRIAKKFVSKKIKGQAERLSLSFLRPTSPGDYSFGLKSSEQAGIHAIA